MIFSHLEGIVERGEEKHSLRWAIERSDDKTPEETSYHMICKDSKKVYEIKTKYLPILSSQGYKLVVVKDQTVYEQMVKERSMKKYQRVLLSSITHEIRNPLNSTMGPLALIAETDSLPEAKQAGINISLAVQQIRYIVASACDLTMIDISTLVLQPTVFDLREAIQNVINVIRPNLEAKPIVLRIIKADSVPDLVSSDSSRYELILFHLLSNAVKYTMEGEIKVTLNYDRKTEMLRTSVSDTGIGISSECLSKLYQLYANVENANPYNPQGMGLGLVLCKRLSNLLGGDLEAQSVLGEGSSFDFTIVNVENSEAALRLEAELRVENADESGVHSVKVLYPRRLSKNMEHKNEAKSIKKCSCLKVLVVDDDATNRSVLKSFLRSIRIESDEAEHGQVAVAKVKTRFLNSCCQSYSLILMDLNMPIMDGTAATETLSKFFALNPAARAPIVAVTAANLESYSEVQGLLALGFANIRKPH